MVYLLKRWVVAIILIAATYNPTGWSYLAWVDSHRHLPASIVLLTGFVLLIGFIKYFRQALGAVGGWGITALAFFFVTVIWAMHDYRVVDLNAHDVGIWAILIVCSLVLSIGASWPELRKGRFFERHHRKQNSDDWLSGGD